MKAKCLALFACFLFAVFTLNACTASTPGSSVSPETSPTPSVVPQSPEITPEQTEGADHKIIITQIPAPSLSNNIIEESLEKEIHIYLPPEYDKSDKRYPVIYYLPGFGDPPSVNLRKMDSLIQDGTIQEMIIVAINGRSKLGGSFYTNSPVTGNWEDFITRDVVSYIDENYRTIANADARGIAGHSMGGTGVLNISMHTKDVFNHAYAMSPGVLNEVGPKGAPVIFDLLEMIVGEYKDMDAAAARAAYLAYVEAIPLSHSFSLSYASAFAYDPEGKAPYIKLPNSQDGALVKDEIWTMYDSGFGQVEEKLTQYKENLLNLKTFVVEYGTYDEYAFIRSGCDYLDQKLTEHEIPHEFVTYSGNHNDQIYPRFYDLVVPLFSGNFVTE